MRTEPLFAAGRDLAVLVSRGMRREVSRKGAM
jgi:hypothetical protein